MKVITVPEKLPSYSDSFSPRIFLAGGIVNCPLWQDEVIKLLEPYEGIIFNPRRKSFPIDNPNAAEEQIIWEFNALDEADIFSIWFCNAESIQPICMYELGRHIALREKRLWSIVIGVEPGYRREQDVYIQMEQVSKEIQIVSCLEDFVQNIVNISMDTTHYTNMEATLIESIAVKKMNEECEETVNFEEAMNDSAQEELEEVINNELELIRSIKRGRV